MIKKFALSLSFLIPFLFFEPLPVETSPNGLRERLQKSNTFKLKKLLQIAENELKNKKYKKAIELFEEIVTLQEETFGLEHPNTVQTNNKLASLYTDLGAYDKAEPFYIRVSSVIEKGAPSTVHDHWDPARPSPKLSMIVKV